MLPLAMTVDVTYRGLKVATGARLVVAAPGSSTGFVEVEGPLPVGTRLVFSGEVSRAVRVTGVVEQEAGTKTVAGMRIAWDEPAASVQPASTPELGGTTAAEPRASDSASVTSPTAATSARDAEAAAAEVEPEPEPGDTASTSSPPASTDDTTTTGGGGSRRRRRRKNASRS
jgi:hypothetical protein